MEDLWGIYSKHNSSLTMQLGRCVDEVPIGRVHTRLGRCIDEVPVSHVRMWLGRCVEGR